MRAANLPLIAITLLSSIHFSSFCQAIPSTRRTIRFPVQSIGKTYAIFSTDPVSLLTLGSIKGRFIGSACGTYTIPASEKVFVELDSRVAENPELLKGLAADTAYAVKVGYCDPPESFLAALSKLSDLHRLDIYDCSVFESGVAQLAKLKNLDRLSIDSCEIKGNLANVLQNCKSLHYLSVSGNHLKPAVVAQICQLPKLEYLALARCALSDDALKPAGSLKELKFLDLNSNAAITAKGLEYLKGCSKLDTLRIQFTAVRARDLLKLKGLPLQTVDLHETSLSNGDLKQLTSAFPGCNFILTKKEARGDFKVLFAPVTR